MTIENVTFGFAVILVTAIFGFALFLLWNKKVSDKDRILGFLGTAVAAIGLVISAGQNRLAANDARESAISSKESADAAQASLLIEKAPALTLHCSLNPTGQPEAYFGIGFDTPQGPVETTTLPTAVPRHISYETCVIKNYGRQPILNAVLPTVLQFTGATGASLSSMPQLITHNLQLKVDGIAAGGTYTFWIGNEGQITFLILLPQAVTFSEPDGAPGSFRFSQMPSGSLLEARTPVARGEKQGSIKIIQSSGPSTNSGHN